jgi:murein DD-endopeptidase MepM/ murein hydrolase activator NlpD
MSYTNVMKRILLIINILIFISACNFTSKTENPPANVPKREVAEAKIEKFLGFPLNLYEVVQDTVRRNETLAKILNNHHIGTKEIYELTREIDTLFDPKDIRVGKIYYLIYPKKTQDSVKRPEAFVYQETLADFTVIYLNKNKEKVLEKISKPVTTKEKTISLPIENSLFYDLQKRHISPVLALKLSEIFAWTVDFFHLRPDDKFKAVYFDKYVDTTYLGVGEIKAAVFYHYGDTIYAFKYEYDTINGLYDYFDEKGKTLRKQFLKSPIKFGRITSRYSLRRYVKLYGRIKPHYGTDFAAPVGTPIYSTADGVVEKVGYTRGNGNYVKIRHNSTYATQYLHMRNFAKGIRPGVRVKQGQVIGYVGMTGYTTGPHVCYRFWKNGKQVDPFKQKLPEAKSLDSTLLDDYYKFIAPLKKQLDSLP